VLLALCLLPAAVLTEAVVEDIEITEPREYVLPVDFSPAPAPKAEGFSESKDEAGKKVRIYEDSTIRVVLSETRYYLTEKKDKTGTDIWMADIVITDPSQLRTASFDDGYNFVSKRRQGKVVELAKSVNAIVALNGDSWGAKEEKHNFGIVLRQGQLIESRLDEKGNYRMDLLIIDENGDFHGIHAAEAGDLDDPYTFEGKKVLDIFSFGPILVENGEAVEDYQGVDRSAKKKDGFWMNMRSEEDAQRIAVCQVGPLHYMLVASANDHGNTGLTLRQFADFLVSQGVQFAYNLDGGVSSVLYFHGAGKVNLKSVKQGRSLWDIIYFATAEKE
jgi:exopolysaccharide biosynthesis protein